MGLLFTLAIFVTVGAVAWKKMQRNRAFRSRDDVDGEDATPRLIQSHAEIDAHLKCDCGGTRVKEGEGPRGDLWRVLTHCASCGRRRALLFQIAN